MKKWIKFVGVFAIVATSIVALAGVAFAQEPQDDGNVPPIGPVDKDGDGLCDVCGREIGEGFARGWRFIRDGEAQWQGRGPSGNGNPLCDGFVDENGDGVCDNALSEGFVDENGDGICDNAPREGSGGEGSRPFAGQGRSRMGGRGG